MRNEWGKSLFRRMAAFCYKRAKPYMARSAMLRKVESNLTKLHPGVSGDGVVEEYYIHKISLSLLVAAVGLVLGLLVSVNAQNSRVVRENGLVLREEVSEESLEMEVIAEYEGMKIKLPMEIRPRELTVREAEKMLAQLETELPELIRGTNEDLENVRTDLMLADSYEEFPAVVEWKSNRPDVVSGSGVVKEVEEATLVLLTAKLCYGECVRECSLKAVVRPPVLSAEEQLRRELDSMLKATDEESSTQAEWQLPMQWNGKEIRWQQVVGDDGTVIWLGALAVSVLLYFCSDRDLEEKVAKRRAKMRHEYPEIVHKLVLFAEAGMTLRGALQKIAGDCGRQGDAPAYEEIAYACNELSSGISERAVYERMGKRIALQEYIRLGTLMTQNLKRGNTTLIERLREEADRAAEEQLQTAKRYGEEAGTKLLVPMVLQLAVVMVMIMVPVFLTM